MAMNEEMYMIGYNDGYRDSQFGFYEPAEEDVDYLNGYADGYHDAIKDLD